MLNQPISGDPLDARGGKEPASTRMQWRFIFWESGVVQA